MLNGVLRVRVRDYSLSKSGASSLSIITLISLVILHGATVWFRSSVHVYIIKLVIINTLDQLSHLMYITVLTVKVPTQQFRILFA